jgi:adenylate kinase family enzyme
MRSTPISVLFYGLSGSGKGTQAQLLAKYLELEAPEPRTVLYIETGSRLRGFTAVGGYSNSITRSYLDGGKLLPSFMPIHIWTTALVEQFTGAEHLILDGLARREMEVPILNAALDFYGRSDYHVITLDISDEVAAERLRSRGRVDDKDNEENINNKIAWYKENVEPCIAAFGKLGKPVHHLNGERSIEDIQMDVRSALSL